MRRGSSGRTPPASRRSRSITRAMPRAKLSTGRRSGAARRRASTWSATPASCASRARRSRRAGWGASSTSTHRCCRPSGSQAAAAGAGRGRAHLRLHGPFRHAELDAGPIVAQAAVPVLAGDTADTLAERILTAEHRLYPLALRLVAGGEAQPAGRQVVLQAAINHPGASTLSARVWQSRRLVTPRAKKPRAWTRQYGQAREADATSRVDRLCEKSSIAPRR